MRDAARIERVVRKVRLVWHIFPDLRLGQLIGNLTPEGQDSYYFEDDVLERRLDKIIDNHLSDRPWDEGVNEIA